MVVKTIKAGERSKRQEGRRDGPQRRSGQGRASVEECVQEGPHGIPIIFISWGNSSEWPLRLIKRLLLDSSY